MTDKINYEDLKLGEKAVEMYKNGSSIDDIAENSAVYLNTKENFNGLNNTDMIIANVLAGGNTLLVGRSGCGKSQLTKDIHNYYFGGSVDAGGKGLTIEGDAELRIMEDVFTSIDKEKAKRFLNKRADANYINLEEINRCPPFTQNQFFSALNNRLIYGGEEKELGSGFCATISTANLGNGEYRGTFDSDKALYNRFGLVVNLDEKEFMPAYEDRVLMKKIRHADSKLKQSPKKDIADKILQANKEIKANSLNLGFESEAVMEFLEESLNNCSQNKSIKDLEWHIQNRVCQSCPLNLDAPQKYAICSMVQSPVERTLNSIRSYASAMDYLLKLKGVDKNVSPRDLVFKAFELTSAYQGALNPFISKTSFNEKNSSMMKDAAGKLREDYMKNEDRILTIFEAAKKGIKPSSLFYLKKSNSDDKVLRGDFETLAPKLIKKIEEKGGEISRKEFEFNDDALLGYSWAEKSAEYKAEENNQKKENKK